MKCADCAAYVEEKQHCCRYPTIVEKKVGDWCLEFKAREVTVCPVMEEKKEEKAKVAEKAESEIDTFLDNYKPKAKKR